MFKRFSKALAVVMAFVMLLGVTGCSEAEKKYLLNGYRFDSAYNSAEAVLSVDVRSFAEAIVDIRMAEIDYLTADEKLTEKKAALEEIDLALESDEAKQFLTNGKFEIGFRLNGIYTLSSSDVDLDVAVNFKNVDVITGKILVREDATYYSRELVNTIVSTIEGIAMQVMGETTGAPNINEAFDGSDYLVVPFEDGEEAPTFIGFNNNKFNEEAELELMLELFDGFSSNIVSETEEGIVVEAGTKELAELLNGMASSLNKNSDKVCAFVKANPALFGEDITDEEIKEELEMMATETPVTLDEIVKSFEKADCDLTFKEVLKDVSDEESVSEAVISFVYKDSPVVSLTSTSSVKEEKAPKFIDVDSLKTIDYRLFELKMSGESCFTDLDSVPWAEEYITELYIKGIINGYDNGTFMPSNNVKRADYIIMLLKAADIDLSEEAATNFSDVREDKYYANAVGLAKQYGIATGADNKFAPESYITRQDMMVLAKKVVEYKSGETLSGDTSSLAAFADNDQISEYAKESLAAMVEAGIVSGTDKGIEPKANTTRAQSAVIIARLLDYIEQ